MEPGKKLASAEQLKGTKNSGKQSGKAGAHRRPLLAAAVLAALALAIGIYFISGRTQPQPQPAEESTTASRQPEMVKLISRSREEVAEVTITAAGQSSTVVNGKTQASGPDGRHTLKEQPDFDLDQNKAEAIVGYAASLTANRLVTDQAEDPAAYGLAEPKAIVTMRYTDGTETAWCVGDQAPTSTASYFMPQGTQTVYLLYASAAESLSTGRSALHTLAMPGTLDSSLIRSLQLEAEGRDTLEVGYSEEGEADKGYSISALRLRQPFYHTANAERTQQLFEDVAALTLSAYAGELGELADTGLAEGEGGWRLTVRQARSKENLSDHSNQETFVFRIGNRTADGQQAYLMTDDTQAVYLTPASAVGFLENATPAYLVDSFANLIYIQAVNRITIEAGGEHWQLDIEHPEEKNAGDVYRFNGQEVRNASAFRKLYQQIVGMTTSKISPDYFLQGETVLSVHYQLDVEPGELLVEYLDYDADYYAVRRDGLTLFLIKRQQVETLREALAEFSPDAS